MKKRVTWKGRLRPFGELVQTMYSQVTETNSRDLVHLANACKKASTTNIGWHSYEAAQLLPKMIRDEQYRRRQVAALGKREVQP